MQLPQLQPPNAVLSTASRSISQKVALCRQVKSSHPNRRSRTLPAKFVRPTTAPPPTSTTYPPTWSKFPSMENLETSARPRQLVRISPAPVEARSLPSATLPRYLLDLADAIVTVSRARVTGLSLIAVEVVADTTTVVPTAPLPVTNKILANPNRR